MAVYALSTTSYGLGYPSTNEDSSSTSEQRAADTLDAILEVNDRLHEPEGVVLSEGTYTGVFAAGNSSVTLNTLVAAIPYLSRKLLVNTTNIQWTALLDNSTYWLYATVVPASGTQLYSVTITAAKTLSVPEPACPANSILLAKAVTTGAAITVTSTEAGLGTGTAKQWFYDMWTHRTAATLDHPALSVTNAKVATGVDPEKIDDYSSNAAEMQTTADPYPGAVESLATDLTGELARIRYVIKQLSGETQWYIDPDTDAASIASHIADTSDPHGAAMTVSTSISVGGSLVTVTTHDHDGGDGAVVPVAGLAAAVQDLMPNCSITVGGEAADVIQVSVQFRDAANNNLAEYCTFEAILSDSAHGGVSADPPSGGWAAGVGALLAEHTANLWSIWETNSSGLCRIDITEAGADTWYLLVMFNGKSYWSGTITFAV